MPNFYIVENDVDVPHMWNVRLKPGRFGLPGELYGGGFSERTEGCVEVESSSGIPRDFAFDLSGIPVVSERLRKSIEPLVTHDAQFLPIDEPALPTSYYAVVVVNHIPCVDRRRTVLVFSFEEFDDFSAAKPLVLTRSTVGSHSLFRVRESPITVCVSDQVREVYTGNACSGAAFVPIDVV